MKFSLMSSFVILLLALASKSWAASREYCESSVAERIRLLRNDFQVFKTNAAFDPIDSTKPITKYETYPNGWFSYRTDSNEIGISGDILWNMNYLDEHGDQQTLRVNSVGKEFEVTHGTEVVAVLSTVQIFDEQEAKKPEYIPVLKKMIAMYKSATQFHANLENNKIPGIDGKVTHYEITPDGELQLEKDFTLKITENISKTDEINGKYTCRFKDVVRHMHGHYGNDYIYRIKSDDLTLTDKYVAAVL